MGLACCPNPTLPPVASLFYKLKKNRSCSCKAEQKGQSRALKSKERKAALYKVK